MKIELTEYSNLCTIRTRYVDVVDRGTSVGELDDGLVYHHVNRLAYMGLVWRIPYNIKYNSINIYYKDGSDIPIAELLYFKEETI